MVDYFAKRVPVSRVVVNTPGALGGIGGTTGLMPALTLGCGAVGGSATVSYTHLPTQSGVMAAAALAEKENCDFVIGLGGGSSVDTAKATAIMMKNPGVLWDYAQTGTGKNQSVSCAVPIVTISTTCGTGTETDPYCVITNEAVSYTHLNGIMVHRHTAKLHEPRGIYCGIGQCTDCVMTVNGKPNVRTCITPCLLYTSRCV